MIFGEFVEWRRVLALTCAVVLLPAHMPVLSAAPQQAPAEEQKPKLKAPEQLDSLVAPVALYPDPLLAQVLAASTYPLEVVQVQRWLKSNSTLKGEELTKAAAKQPWDASVQALVAFPSALKLLDDNIQWTTELGNAFLDQQSDVMDAVQRMRKKAKDNGKLESSKEQKVEVKTVETKTIVEIRPADPQVIYVPTYQPTVVYGPPVYAYPPVVYPSTGAMITTAAISFGVGVAMGAFWSGCCHGGYGWNTGWHGGNNNITINNNFQNRYGYANVNGGNRTNINGGNRVAAGNGNSWQHNPSHRKSVPYDNPNTARQFGGTSRDSAGRTDRGGQARSTQADRGLDRGSQGGNRDSGRGDRAQPSARSGGGSQDRVGDRSIGSDSGRGSAFGGAGSRSQTTAASDRGFSSSRESGGGAGGGSRSAGSRSSGRSSGGGGGRRR